MQATALPLWAFALAAAVFAPFCARAVGQALDKRARERTLLALGGRAVAKNTEAGAPSPDS